MKLAVMTRPTFFVEEDKILSSLFDEGLDNLHLYKPGSSPMYSERLLTLLSEDYHKRITVHDNFYLKEEYKLKGIHIEDETSPAPQGYKGHISRTCTHLDQLKEAKRHADYVFLKYIGDSQSEATAIRGSCSQRTHRPSCLCLRRYESRQCQISQRSWLWRYCHLWRHLESLQYTRGTGLSGSD